MVFPGWYTGGSSGGGVTDHGNLDGLADDDHPQYRLESEDHTHESTGLQGGLLPASVSAMEYISSIELTSAMSTANFSMPSTYTHYLFVLSNVVLVTDAQVVYIRTSEDGGSNYDAGASDYSWVNQILALAGRADVVDEADSEIELRPGIGSDTAEDLSGVLEVIAPARAAFTHIVFDISSEGSAGQAQHMTGSGRRLSAVAVDAIRFIPSSGNFESGRIDKYGLKVPA